MKVQLIAQTSLDLREAEDTDEVISLLGMTLDDESSGSEDLIELSGRACYQSFHKPNEKTRRNADYVANLLRQGHTSVLEHASASFYVTGVSRNMLLELERHRHLSFSVQSQRFVDESEASFIVPPAMEDDDEWDWSLPLHVAQQEYRDLVDYLQNDRGLPRKQAREAARSILPGGVETRFVVTGNLRAWRDVLAKRHSKHADREIALFAREVLILLKGEVAPSVFADMDPEVQFD